MSLKRRLPGRLVLIGRKGGVGKTTLTVELAVALARIFGIRVLIIDQDPQATAAKRVGLVLPEDARTLNDVYSWVLEHPEFGLHHAVQPTAWPGVYIVASEEALAFREYEGDHLQDFRLRLSIARSERELGEFGAILIDTQPGIGPLLRNSILGASHALVVTNSEPDGILAADKAMGALREIQVLQHPELTILGFLVNDYDGRVGEHQRCTDDLVAAHGDLALTPWVPRRADVGTARGKGVSVQTIASNGARDYTRKLNIHARRIGAALELQEIQ